MSTDKDYWESLISHLKVDVQGLYDPLSSRSLMWKIHQPEFREYRDPEGHVTGSALILDASKKFMVLVHHLKLQRWIQPGGHIEPGEAPFEAAAREAREECGLKALELLSTKPIDIDVHKIPEGKDPAHMHFDLRYLFVHSETVFRPHTWQSELKCQWIRLDDLGTVTNENSVLRLAAKARSFILNPRYGSLEV